MFGKQSNTKCVILSEQQGVCASRDVVWLRNPDGWDHIMTRSLTLLGSCEAALGEALPAHSADACAAVLHTWGTFDLCGTFCLCIQLSQE